MRKIVMISSILLLLLSFSAFASDLSWHTANELTLAWSPVTKNNQGESISDVIHYEIAIVSASSVDRNKDKVIIGSTEATQHQIEFNEEGRFILGVRAVRIIEGEALSTSTWAWSDDPSAAKEGRVFGGQFFFPLASPQGMQKL